MTCLSRIKINSDVIQKLETAGIYLRMVKISFLFQMFKLWATSRSLDNAYSMFL